MSIFFWITTVSIISAIISFLGIYAAYKNRSRIEAIKNSILCFAAGVLISTPLLIAFPKSFQNNKNAGIYVLSGFLFMWFTDKMFNKFMDNKHSKTGWMGALAIGFHSFIDGIIYSVTFSASIMIGFLSSIGLVAHELAEGIITFTFLTEAGVSSKKALFYSFFIAGFTTPMGAFIVYPFLISLSKEILSLLIALVGGILIYFSASHLIPEVRESSEKHSHLAFLLGLFFAVFLYFLG